MDLRVLDWNQIYAKNKKKVQQLVQDFAESGGKTKP
jgi:hypothetical protein